MNEPQAFEDAQLSHEFPAYRAFVHIQRNRSRHNAFHQIEPVLVDVGNHDVACTAMCSHHRRPDADGAGAGYQDILTDHIE